MGMRQWRLTLNSQSECYHPTGFQTILHFLDPAHFFAIINFTYETLIYKTKSVLEWSHVAIQGAEAPVNSAMEMGQSSYFQRIQFKYFLK